MFSYSTNDKDIIENYNDYLFLKFNYDDYFEELSLLVVDICNDSEFQNDYKDTTNKSFKEFLIQDKLRELNKEQIKIIKSHFNPVIFKRMKKIYKKYSFITQYNQFDKFPMIYSKYFFHEFKSMLYHKIKIDKFMNSNSDSD
jgi:hypothetical protein